jgi:hypothetical protein
MSENRLEKEEQLKPIAKAFLVILNEVKDLNPLEEVRFFASLSMTRMRRN